MLGWICKRSIPILTLSQSLLIFIYYVQPSSVISTSFDFGTLFHVTFALVLGLLPSLLVVKMKYYCVLYSDLVFLVILGVFNFALAMAFFLNWAKVIEHTYGLIITCLSLAIIVGFAFYNECKQGAYDNEINL